MTTDSAALDQNLRLKPEQLTVPIDLANMGFTTTDDLEPFRGILCAHGERLEPGGRFARRALRPPLQP